MIGRVKSVPREKEKLCSTIKQAKEIYQHNKKNKGNVPAE